LLSSASGAAQVENGIDIYLHDEALRRLLKLDIPHPAEVCLGPFALAAKALALA
jgi:hypothetical protein